MTTKLRLRVVVPQRGSTLLFILMDLPSVKVSFEERLQMSNKLLSEVFQRQIWDLEILSFLIVKVPVSLLQKEGTRENLADWK